MSKSQRLPLETRLTYVIAEELGEDPDELSPPLDDVINVDALEELFADREDGTSRGHGLVSFRYRDIYVNVDDQGFVTIEGSTRGPTHRHHEAEVGVNAD